MSRHVQINAIDATHAAGVSRAMAKQTPLAKWLETTATSPADLADVCGVHRSQIYRIKAGQQRARPELAQELERITGIPAWDFVKP